MHVLLEGLYLSVIVHGCMYCWCIGQETICTLIGAYVRTCIFRQTAQPSQTKLYTTQHSEAEEVTWHLTLHAWLSAHFQGMIIYIRTCTCSITLSWRLSLHVHTHMYKTVCCTSHPHTETLPNKHVPPSPPPPPPHPPPPWRACQHTHLHCHYAHSTATQASLVLPTHIARCFCH